MSCSVSACQSRVLARGMCSKHYDRWRKHGDPTITLAIRFPPGTSEEDRFWPRVQKSDGCWNWTGALFHDGYGNFTDDCGATIRAHRWAYEALVGPIPAGLVIDHLCRNRACVRPDHMEPVTVRENTMRGLAPGVLVHLSGRCANGHEMTPANTYIHAPSGARRCRACNSRRSREYRERRAALSQKEPA